MPPKKKGAAKAKAKTAATRSSVPDTVTTSRGKEYATTAAMSRPRRESTLDTPTAVKKTATAAKKTAAAATPTKKRGRPAKAPVDEEPPAKRGRRATKTAEVAVFEDESELQEEEEPANEPVATPRPRGRPPGTGKKGKRAAAAKATFKAAPKPPAKRGRPAKAKAAAVENDEGEVGEEGADEDAPPPKKRGRPAKARAAVAEDDEGEVGEENADEDAPPPQKRGRGRPAKKAVGKAKGKGAKVKVPTNDEEEADDGEEQDQTTSGKQYWLMKAEQEDREEPLANGEMFNTKFTIDDLKSKGGPEPWDGVRNALAAKNMRAMKQGDLAFFYASGGKSGRKPGIVGIMEIVKESEPDQTASDEGAYGYVEDANARDRWCVVHVEFRKKLSSPVHLAQLQKFSEGNGVLNAMQVIKQSRLSVTGVTEAEWNFITERLVEGYEEDEGDALPKAEGRNGASNGTINAEEDSTLITTEQPDGDVVINESSQKEEAELPPGIAPAGLALPTIESENPSTDTIFPAETSQTSRPASRQASRAPSVKAKATTSRQSSRAPSVKPTAAVSRQSSRASSVGAGSLAPPMTNGRGRSRTPKVRAGIAAPASAGNVDAAAGMQTIGEDDE